MVYLGLPGKGSGLLNGQEFVSPSLNAHNACIEHIMLMNGGHCANKQIFPALINLRLRPDLTRKLNLNPTRHETPNFFLGVYF